MNAIILGALKIMGWQKLLNMVWNAVKDDLKAAAAKSAPHWDDEAVQILDELIKAVASTKA